ncbi:Piso0_004129 [Millerozyma farinosa CBS 7064]|uniref:Mevalonate kinase n=1 Tax=Pichia sorbitophila (strain ATCC MYA-4447 / BCRC 22081 / CBS 7064 / NBRC 10061 / NRRL Y-12695) TaxID=559304 RepID=G8Y7K1_PICSO|nr:Piso0_004129 [Millerozyma farinosa CBS 7064]CCE84581.1 Piso0_004129 [Millerozyma farinosa CBS 7064]
MSSSGFLVSAPGKVILFGEHSAVYGKPAIAAALSLRTYLLVKPNERPNEITLKFDDIELLHSWKIDELPWDKLKPLINIEDGVPEYNEYLVPEIDNILRDYLGDTTTSRHFIACHCFLYLYVHLCSSDSPGMVFDLKSTLPIGAGLGSSASVSVCLSTAFSLLGKHISRPVHEHDEKSAPASNDTLDFIDKWSLIGEKCFHGNPSGIDNAVATYGGAVMYQRMKSPSLPSVRTTMRNFPSLQLLLTNTKVPRSTASLVGRVAEIVNTHERCAEAILDAMGHLVASAYEIMIKPDLPQADKEKLLELVNVNHGLLSALDVSHPSLEKVRIISSSHGIGYTKLTGAGGGGCAITLIKDGVKEAEINKAIEEFKNEGYDTFETALGGKGVGVLDIKDLPAQYSNKPLHDIFALNQEELESVLHHNTLQNWKFW